MQKLASSVIYLVVMSAIAGFFFVSINYMGRQYNFPQYVHTALLFVAMGATIMLTFIITSSLNIEHPGDVNQEDATQSKRLKTIISEKNQERRMGMMARLEPKRLAYQQKSAETIARFRRESILSGNIPAGRNMVDRSPSSGSPVPLQGKVDPEITRPARYYMVIEAPANTPRQQKSL